MKVLVGAGCEVNTGRAEFRGNYGPPVVIAAVTQQRAMVETLLEAGADINHVSNEDPWPITRAALEESPAA